MSSISASGAQNAVSMQPWWRRLELPTWLLALSIYAGWFALTASWRVVPLWISVPLAAWLLAWHGSFQHEAVHDHPTPWRVVNALVAGVPVSLWLPFAIYRESHLLHHRTSHLTDPVEDPESYYVTPAAWARAGALQRTLMHVQSTLVGRLVLGPWVMLARFGASELRRLVAGDRARVGVWTVHALSCLPVLYWVVAVCGIPVWAYVLGFVYPGIALSLLRSFAEHRPASQPHHRSVIVEAGPVLSLLFLNNNLHAVHHRQPRLPWYELPARFHAERDAVLAHNGGYHFGGYGEIARRFALRVKDTPVHPLVGG